MTKVVDTPLGKVIVIEAEEDGKCEMCGEINELRPYGPEGKRVCFSCAMKDPINTLKQFAKMIGREIDDSKITEEFKVKLLEEVKDLMEQGLTNYSGSMDSQSAHVPAKRTLH